MKRYLQKLFRGEALNRAEACEAMSIMMRGEAQAEELAAFLGAIAARGEAKDEIVGCVEAMRAHALPFPVKRRDLIDVCGTGGDGAETFNISTTNALVLAAAGLGVVKHGNRAVSSQSGSADVLEKLGLTITGTPDELARRVDQAGFAFLFAPAFHPAMKHIAPVRKALGLRTIFNLLGPLANPAPVQRQVIGVYARKLVPLLAEAARDLGTEHTLIVWGEDGLDELSLSAPTIVAEVKGKTIRHLTLTPEDFGLARGPLTALKGGTSETNALITKAIISGEKGAKRDIVLMNAGAALVVAGFAKTWREGAELAAQLIDTGKAQAKLLELETLA